MKRGLVALLAMVSAAAADEVLLTSGGKLSGIVRSEDAASVTVELGAGTVAVPRDQVKEIRRGSSALSEFYERAGRLKESKDAAAIAELASWARGKGLERHARRQFERVLQLDPNHVAARRALGFALHEGKWLTRTELLAATGHVLFRGRWMTESERNAILAREEEAKKKREEQRRRREDAELEAYVNYLDRLARSYERERARRSYRPSVLYRHYPWGYTGTVTFGSGGCERPPNPFGIGCSFYR